MDVQASHLSSEDASKVDASMSYMEGKMCTIMHGKVQRGFMLYEANVKTLYIFKHCF